MLLLADVGEYSFANAEFMAVNMCDIISYRVISMGQCKKDITPVH